MFWVDGFKKLARGKEKGNHKFNWSSCHFKSQYQWFRIEVRNTEARTYDRAESINCKKKRLGSFLLKARKNQRFFIGNSILFEKEGWQ